VKVVLDSNLGVALVIPLPYSEAAIYQMQQWLISDVELIVPTLWSYEVVSTLRKASVAMKLSAEQMTIALQSIFALQIQEVPPTPLLHQRSLEWSILLNQTVAYDAAFLALAESLGAEFWTADRRLVNTVRALGIGWVHHLV
jgi:predicted nucleic acid-binding protein